MEDFVPLNINNLLLQKTGGKQEQATRSSIDEFQEKSAREIFMLTTSIFKHG